MGALTGRVAIITGAGRGLGRAHALYLASEGARVVVNDLGVDMTGRGTDITTAEVVVAEIVALGGEAVANHDNVADWDGGRRLIESAVDHFGALHVLVNNAGILRDRALVNMTEDEWDDVMAVHLRGCFIPTRHAATYWRAQSKSGATVTASVVNTSSTSGLLGNPFQTNYGAAKAGVAAFTIIAAHELGRYGVRVNAIVPAARTRLTSATEGLTDIVKEPEDGVTFDIWDPANVSPLVGWLSLDGCPATGKVLFIQGGRVQLMVPWSLGEGIDRPHRLTLDDLDQELRTLVE